MIGLQGKVLRRLIIYYQKNHAGYNHCQKEEFSSDNRSEHHMNAEGGTIMMMFEIGPVIMKKILACTEKEQYKQQPE